MTEKSMETVVNYIVEARKRGHSWITMQNVGDNPDDGEAAYQNWLSARGSLEIRLIKRTAVITDEVLSLGRQGKEW